MQIHGLSVVVVLALCVVVASGFPPEKQKGKPHIFLVLADDLGWGNLGFRAGADVKDATTKNEVVTPNIDQLVKEGLLLDRHYTYSYCSPSRSSLQTGRLPVHVVVTNDDPIVINPDNPISGYSGAPPNMTGIAEKLASGGYKTHMTGKWDVGMATREQVPSGKGFESYFGYLHHAVNYRDETLGVSSTATVDVCYDQGDKVVDLWQNDGPARNKNGTKYLEYLFTENSLQIIQKHDPSVPLFLFHSFHLCHTPLDVPLEYEDRFKFLKDESRRKYAAMTNMMDEQLGLLVQALKDKKMWENTLMIFSSDNGGPNYSFAIPGKTSVFGGANNIPLRGGKLSDFEGGIRVNAFVSGGYLPESRRGKSLEKYIHITDWYATFCELAGVDPHDEKSTKFNLPPVDSVSVLDMILKEDAAAARNELHISTNTLIQGQYKIITGSDLSIFLPGAKALAKNLKHFVPMNGYWPGWGLKSPVRTLTNFKLCSPACLYDIHTDPYETTDLFHHQKDLGIKMLNRLAKLNESYFNPNRGTQNPQACNVFKKKYKGFYGPFAEDIAGQIISHSPQRESLQSYNLKSLV